MATWREWGIGREGSKGTKDKREQERREGTSIPPPYSGLGLSCCCQVSMEKGIPGCCQVTVGVESSQNTRGLVYKPSLIATGLWS